jgi:hypothetical protein
MKAMDMNAAGATAMELARRIIVQPDTLGDGDCEAQHAGVLSQPANTISSLGYVAGGMWLLTRVGRIERGERIAAIGYAVSVSMAGAGSVAYHGPQFPGAQLLHDLPIIAMVGIGFGVPAVRMVRREQVLTRGGRSRALGAVGFAIAAGLSYLGGRTGSATCRPDSALQLHSLWHLGTAAAATLWGTALWSLGPCDGDGPDPRVVPETTSTGLCAEAGSGVRDE